MSSQPRFRLKLIVIALTLLYSGLSKAEDVVVNPITPGSLPALSPSQNISGNVFFPLYPRLNVTGGMGNNNFGAADVMAPLFGSTDAIVYTDLGGQTGKGKSHFLSLGLGVRDAVNDDLMWGGYVFVDRSKSNDADGGAHWTVFNPGAEFMTNHWDGRINAYIPSSDKQNVRGPFFGDQVNEPGAISFNHHDQFSRLFNQVEEIGTGLDVDTGYTFTNLKRFRVHGGAYYFQLGTYNGGGGNFLHPVDDTSNIIGGEIGAEMPINNYATLLLDDSYDKTQKNTAVVSLRFTLGGIDKFANEPTVQDRILDPVYRHLGALRTNTGIPSTTGLWQISGPPVLERSNVWFFNANNGVAFDPSAGDDNCTFEHPCIGTSFNQSNINTINGFDSNANFYFTPGTYTFGDLGRLNLYSGQSMYGRTGSYALPASSATGFPTFVGGLDPQGNNTLDSFALINNGGAQSIGIHIQNANNIFMNNLQIGQLNTAESFSSTPLKLDNASNITLKNSTVNSFGNLAGGLSINQSTFTADSNTFNVVTDSPNVAIIRINSGSTNSTVTLNNNIANITNNNLSASAGTFGIQTVTTSVTPNVVNASNNQININSKGGDAYGFYDYGSKLNATSNTITMNTDGNAIGIYNDFGTVDGTANTLTLNAVDTATGALNASGTMSLNNNTFNITAGGLFAMGALNFGTLNLTGNSFTIQNPVGGTTGLINDVAGTTNLNNNKFFLTSNLFNVGINNFGGNPGAITGSNNTFTITGTGTNIFGSNVGTFFSNSSNNNTCILNGIPGC